MTKKRKKFAEGGLSEAQEKWLGGADRNDPIIMARMRAAVPDEVKEKVSTPAASVEKEDIIDLAGDEKPFEKKAEPRPTPKATPKAVVEKKVSVEKFSPAKEIGVARKKTPDFMMKSLGYKSGGSVKSSASKRADGIAQRGKTKGRIC